MKCFKTFSLTSGSMLVGMCMFGFVLFLRTFASVRGNKEFHQRDLDMLLIIIAVIILEFRHSLKFCNGGGKSEGD